MEPELLTTKQAASVMNIGEERARAILLSRGVQPVSLPWGKERKTLRWSRRAVPETGNEEFGNARLQSVSI